MICNTSCVRTFCHKSTLIVFVFINMLGMWASILTGAFLWAPEVKKYKDHIAYMNSGVCVLALWVAVTFASKSEEKKKENDHIYVDLSHTNSMTSNLSARGITRTNTPKRSPAASASLMRNSNGNIVRPVPITKVNLETHWKDMGRAANVSPSEAFSPIDAVHNVINGSDGMLVHDGSMSTTSSSLKEVQPVTKTTSPSYGVVPSISSRQSSTGHVDTIPSRKGSGSPTLSNNSRYSLSGAMTPIPTSRISETSSKNLVKFEAMLQTKETQWSPIKAPPKITTPSTTGRQVQVGFKSPAKKTVMISPVPQAVISPSLQDSSFGQSGVKWSLITSPCTKKSPIASPPTNNEKRRSRPSPPSPEEEKTSPRPVASMKTYDRKWTPVKPILRSMASEETPKKESPRVTSVSQLPRTELPKTAASEVPVHETRLPTTRSSSGGSHRVATPKKVSPRKAKMTKEVTQLAQQVASDRPRGLSPTQKQQFNDFMRDSIIDRMTAVGSTMNARCNSDLDQIIADAIAEVNGTKPPSPVDPADSGSNAAPSVAPGGGSAWRSLPSVQAEKTEPLPVCSPDSVPACFEVPELIKSSSRAASFVGALDESAIHVLEQTKIMDDRMIANLGSAPLVDDMEMSFSF